MGYAKIQADDVTREISTRWFGDGIHHWRHIRDESRVMQPLPDQPAYRADQVRQIADNLLLFQRDNGGWPKDYDMLAVLNVAQREQIAATRSLDDTSFDNHNIFSQVEYLAHAFVRLNDSQLRDACTRGLDFMLAAQYPNGGFPQRYPGATGFHAQITFNDGAMIGALRVLKDAGDSQPHFGWLEASRREDARDAVRRGLQCILNCQIRVDGQPTGWCQQHDRNSYAPVSARTFELASICPQDTTEIVRFLMSVESPTPECINAIEAAVAWLKQVQLAGVRIRRVPAPRAEFLRHTADFDVVVVSDAAAPPLWARHYEMGTNRPVFAGRDGVRKDRLADIELERRTGTAWYGGWPQPLLTQEYPAWRERPRQPGATGGRQAR